MRTDLSDLLQGCFFYIEPEDKEVIEQAESTFSTVLALLTGYRLALEFLSELCSHYVRLASPHKRF